MRYDLGWIHRKGDDMSWILWLSLGHAEVLINEVLYDPSGSDGPLEWVEICNNSQDDIDISGWMIEVTSSIDRSVDFSSRNNR